jgi:hypothetical protein
MMVKIDHKIFPFKIVYKQFKLFAKNINDRYVASLQSFEFFIQKQKILFLGANFCDASNLITVH